MKWTLEPTETCRRAAIDRIDRQETDVEARVRTRDINNQRPTVRRPGGRSGIEHGVVEAGEHLRRARPVLRVGPQLQKSVASGGKRDV